MIISIERGHPIAPDEALSYGPQLTSTIRTLAARVDVLVLLLGGRGTGMKALLTRVWSNLCAARGHPGDDPASMVTALCGDMFGAAAGDRA